MERIRQCKPPARPVYELSDGGISFPGRSGFTLMELLVVVAIIAVLAVLAMPSYRRMVDSSQASSCASNLHQMGVGFQLYAADHDGCYPPLSSSGFDGWSGQTQLFGGSLWPYLYPTTPLVWPDNDLQAGKNKGADKNVFHCPVTRRYAQAGSDFHEILVPGGAPGPGAGMSYAINHVLGASKTGNYHTPFKALLVQHPSQTVLVTECYAQTNYANYYYNKYGLIPHGGGANFLFCDGHVAWLKIADVPLHTGSSSTFWTGN